MLLVVVLVGYSIQGIPDMRVLVGPPPAHLAVPVTECTAMAQQGQDPPTQVMAVVAVPGCRVECPMAALAVLVSLS